jgi:centrosomal protein CEP104
MARELQCVRLDTQAVLQVKLVCHQPYQNEVNPQHHIGIIGLSLLGWKHVLSSLPETETALPSNSATASSHTKSISQSVTTSGVSSQAALDTQSDVVVHLVRRAEELRLAKESAVKNEAYDEAMKLKYAEQEVRKQAEMATELDRAKQLAVTREDYEEAKRIKAKIDEILNPKPGLQRLNRPLPASPQDDVSRVKTTERPASPPVPAHQSRKSVSPAKELRRIGNREDEEGAPLDFWEHIESGDEPLPVAEPLEASLKASPDVKNLINTLGMYTVRCLYSAHIRLRSAIIEKLELQIEKDKRGMLVPDFVDSVLHACGMGLSESAPHMFLASAKLLETILSKMSLEDVRQSIICEEVIVPHLVEQFGNQSAHVQEKSTELFLKFAAVLGLDFAVKVVLSRSSTSALARRSTLWRPIHSRLVVLQRLVQSEEFEPAKWTLEILEWMKQVAAFTHANDQVRDACLDLTVHLYLRYSNKFDIENFLRDNLRSATLDRYFASFAKAETSATQRPTSATSFRSPSKLISVTSSSDRRSNQSSSPARTTQPTLSPSKARAMCQFCQEVNVAFSESPETLDLHFWRDCPMLVHCPHCNQVIEISRLNEHLLAECEYKTNHRACPRCGEAIAAQLFEKHVRRNSCLPAKSSSEGNRCPLCHQDILPFAAGWRSHLMVDGCPNNVRTMPFEEEEEDNFEEE